MNDSSSTRRRFLCTSTLATGALLALGKPLLAQRAPRLDLDLSQHFVDVAHTKFKQTKALLAKEPGLVNACWDWGGGDYETGLGAAAHSGSEHIARYLLERGARMDVFCAAMLGKITIVKAFLEDDPKVIDLRGPHGIPLIAHAKAGKQEAVVDYLKKFSEGRKKAEDNG